MSHRSRSEKWLADAELNFMEWLARSPDLNLIENLWGILARKVYANGRQLVNVDMFKKCVLDASAEISPNAIQSPVGSTQNRCISVIHLKGKRAKYQTTIRCAHIYLQVKLGTAL